MQLSLFSLPVELRQSVLWCRSCSGSADRFALGLRPPLPVGAAPWLRQSCRILAVQSLPSGTIAIQVWVPDSLSASFRTLPQPKGGSRHESNLLLY
jgi:hypothetical protein